MRTIRGVAFILFLIAGWTGTAFCGDLEVLKIDVEELAKKSQARMQEIDKILDEKNKRKDPPAAKSDSDGVPAKAKVMGHPRAASSHEPVYNFVPKNKKE